MNRTWPTVLILGALSGFSTVAVAQTTIDGHITTDQNWTLAGSPYEIAAGTWNIEAGASVSIEPGVAVVFALGANLQVRGALNAVGTEELPVTLSGVAETWQAPDFLAGSSGALEHVELSPGADGMTFSSPVAEQFSINELRIEDPRSWAVRVLGGSLDLTGLQVVSTNRFSRPNAGGVLVESEAVVTLSGSEIRAQESGIRVLDSTLHVERSIIHRTSVAVYYSGTSSDADVTLDHVTMDSNVTNFESYDTSTPAAARTVVTRSVVDGGRFFDRWNGTLTVRESVVFPDPPASFGLYWEDTLHWDPLLVDPASDDYHPTEFSPTRYWDATDPYGAAGALPYLGAPTEGGLRGVMPDDLTVPIGGSLLLTGDLLIPPGRSLRLLPGSSLLVSGDDELNGGVDSDRIEVIVEGTIEADGTRTRPVTIGPDMITSDRDHWYGIRLLRDTEGFGLAQVGVSAALIGISMTDTTHTVADAELFHCTTGLYVDSGAPTLESVILRENDVGLQATDSDIVARGLDVRDNRVVGIKLNNTDLLLEDSVVARNVRGIEIRRGSSPRLATLVGVAIVATSGIGISIDVTSSTSVGDVPLSMVRSIIAHGGSYPIYNSGTNEARPIAVEDSLMWDNQRSCHRIGNCDDFQEIDPQLADPEAGDYQLTTFSYARHGAADRMPIGPFEYYGALAPTVFGYVWEDFSFGASDEPWVLSGELLVQSGSTVTFEPGARFNVVDESEVGIEFTPGSAIIANASDDPVRFVPSPDAPLAAYPRWRGITLTDAIADSISGLSIRGPSIGLAITGPRIPSSISDVEIGDVGVGISVTEATTPILIERNTVFDAATGFLVEVPAEISTNVVAGGSTGIRLDTQGFDALVVHNSVSTSQGVIWVRTDPGDEVTFLNNILAGRDPSTFEAEGEVAFYNNLLSQDWLTDAEGAVVRTGNLVADAELEDIDYAQPKRWLDMRVWASSPAIDAGAAGLTLPTHDFEGRPRTIGAAPDIGAFERIPGENQDPRAPSNVPRRTVPFGESYTLDGSAAYDPDGSIEVAYWTTSSGEVYDGLVAEHVFTTPQTQWAYLTIIDDDGAEDHFALGAEVNYRPVADAGPTVYADAGTEPVYFDGSNSDDREHRIANWHWDFGDGRTGEGESQPSLVYPEPGVYLVTLTITDDRGLSSSDTTFATIFGDGDDAGPLIRPILVADGAPIGSPVVVSAEVLDHSGVAQVLLHYRAVGGAEVVEVPMEWDTEDLYLATIPAEHVVAAGVEYWLTATDAAEPANSSSAPASAPAEVLRFRVASDFDPPAIAHSPRSGEQPPRRAYRVDAQIDDASGVASARLHFRPPAGSWRSVSLAPTGGAMWGGEVPFWAMTEAGLEYYFSAVDASVLGNVGQLPGAAPTEVFVVEVGDIDEDPPRITHEGLSETVPAATAITLAAIVRDASPITEAEARYRTAGGSGSSSVPLVRAGDEAYFATIPAEGVRGPALEYALRVVDDHGNEAFWPAEGAYHSVSVDAVDRVAPTISHTPVGGPVVAGSEVEIEAVVTDETGLASVLVYARTSGDSAWIASPMVSPGGASYQGMIPLGVVRAPGVEYYIEATDSTEEAYTARHPGGAPTTPHAFAVMAPAMGPSIALDAVVGRVDEGTPVPIAAVVTDPDGVASAHLFYRLDGEEAWTELEMGHEGGTRYVAVVPGDEVVPASLAFYVEAEDELGDSARLPGDAPLSYEVIVVDPLEEDLSGPTIHHVPAATAAWGVALEVSAIVTDASGVDSVSVQYRILGGADASAIELSPEGDTSWVGTIPASALRSDGIEYYLVALDTLANESLDPSDAPDTRYQTTTFVTTLDPADMGADLDAGADLDLGTDADLRSDADLGHEGDAGSGTDAPSDLDLSGEDGVSADMRSDESGDEGTAGDGPSTDGEGDRGIDSGDAAGTPRGGGDDDEGCSQAPAAGSPPLWLLVVALALGARRRRSRASAELARRGRGVPDPK